MRKLVSVPRLALVAGVAVSAAVASASPSGQGASAGLCSSETLVCAFAKDGTERPMDECRARQAHAARVLPGDCWDED